MASTPHRILLITPDFYGITHNGGIGTAFYHLAQMLAQHGHEVHVLYTNCQWTDAPHGRIAQCIESLKNDRITVHPLPEHHEVTHRAGLHPVLERALRVYAAFTELQASHSFNVVHVPDWLGQAYFLLHAKKQYRLFSDVHFCVHAHSTSLWHRIHNGESIDTLGDFYTVFMEQQSLAWADHLVSPSHYMLGWYQQEGWAVPTHAQVIPNILPAIAPPLPIPSATTKEIVFFGRLEWRKGVGLFCDALWESLPHLPQDAIVTFLGKHSMVHGQPSAQYIEQRLVHFPRRWQILADKNATEAQHYLKGFGRVAVVASLLENAPYVVMECLAQQIPLIATDTGGTRELVAGDDAARILYAPTAQAMAAKIQQVCTQPWAPAKLAISLEEVQQQWLHWHQALPTLPVLTTEDVSLAEVLRSSAVVDTPTRPLAMYDHSAFPIRYAEMLFASLERQRTQTEAALHAVTHSTTWRATYPVRLVASAVQKCVRAWRARASRGT